MVVDKVKNSDYKPLAFLYKSFFKTHNVFSKPEKEIINYLKKQSEENELVVYSDKGKIRGALYLVNFGQNASGDHKLWKFRHFAFDSEKIGSELLVAAEKRVKASSKTSKIELTIAETENEVSFYKSNGYVEEGALKNHYRWRETCFILSKSFSK